MAQVPPLRQQDAVDVGAQVRVLPQHLARQNQDHRDGNTAF